MHFYRAVRSRASRCRASAVISSGSPATSRIIFTSFRKFLPRPMPRYIAIEIGGTKLQIFAGDEQARILQRWRFMVDRPAGGAGIRDQIKSALPAILGEHNIAAVGVGYGGP